MKTQLSETQVRDLRLVADGQTHGVSHGSCKSLRRRGLVTGDWTTGFVITVTGRRKLAEIDGPKPKRTKAKVS